MIKSSSFSQIAGILWHSILESGGITYNVKDGTLTPDHGFMVALQGREMSVQMPDNLSTFGDWLECYVMGFLDDLSKPGYFLGIWQDDNDKRLYFDVSECIDSLDVAMQVGEERKQIAIFDNVAKLTILLKQSHAKHIPVQPAAA